MDNPRQLYSLMNNSFLGFLLSAAYGAVTTGILWAIAPAELPRYPEAFFVSFNAAIVGGLIMTTAVLVYKTQTYIPGTIENTFTKRELSGTLYYEHRRKFFSIVRSLTFASSCSLGAFGVFQAVTLPFQGWSAHFIVGFVCGQCALGVYVGRKIFYIAQMLKAIESIRVKKDIFSDDKLSGISVYVNCVSTLTVIFVFVAVRSLYYAPLGYTTLLGSSVRSFMLIPAIMAIPIVAMFNYYPRSVVRKLYEQSISHSLAAIEKKIHAQNFSDYEKLFFVVEYDKVSRDELNYRLRMTLTDLPMAVTLGIAILSIVH
jgi:hypothetical protein